MTLPELPPPIDSGYYMEQGQWLPHMLHTEAQLRQYGQLCADKERERWVGAEKELILQFKIHKELLESMNDKLLEEIQRLHEELRKGEA